ncbi:uncharacterized protein LJ264_003570 [Porphyrio hochstetteri]
MATGQAGAQSRGSHTPSRASPPTLGDAAAEPPPQPRWSGRATRGRIYAGAPPARRVGSGRGGARWGGEGPVAAGAPGAAGRRRGAVSRGRGAPSGRCGARDSRCRRWAAGSGGVLFVFLRSQLSSRPGRRGSPVPEGAGRRGRRPRGTAPWGRALVPGGARRFAAREPGGGAHLAAGRRELFRPFLPGKNPPSPGTGFSAPAAAVRLCGRRDVIEKEAGKAETDCTSCADDHGQTYPIPNSQAEVLECILEKGEKET